MTLLDEAKKVVDVGRDTKITWEELEIALAWFNGEISDLQASKVLKSRPSNIRGKFAKILRQAVIQNKVTLTLTQKKC